MLQRARSQSPTTHAGSFSPLSRRSGRSWPARQPSVMERLLRAGLTGLSAAALCGSIALAIARMGPPLPLDRAEGAWASEVARVVGGQPLYAAPPLAYVPPPAMPGFALLAASLGLLFGPQLWVL